MLLFLVDSYYRYIILQLIIFTKLPYTSHLGILCRDFITSGEDTLLAIKIQSQLAEKDIDIESLNTQITELQKTISNLKMENLTIEAQLYNTAALVNKFYAELQETKKTVSALTADLQLSEAEKAELESQLATIEGQLSDTLLIVENLEAENTSLQEALNEANATIESANENAQNHEEAVNSILDESVLDEALK